MSHRDFNQRSASGVPATMAVPRAALPASYEGIPDALFQPRSKPLLESRGGGGDVADFPEPSLIRIGRENCVRERASERASDHVQGRGGQPIKHGDHGGVWRLRMRAAVVVGGREERRSARHRR